MSAPQKTMFSLLSLCQKFSHHNRSKFDKVVTKNKFAQFFETRYMYSYILCHNFVGEASAISQPTRPTQPAIPPGSVTVK